MCIIAIKPAGVKLPKGDTLETMWINNDDGAGLMYPRDGKVEIYKGYMTYKSFSKALKALKREIDTRQRQSYSISVLAQGAIRRRCPSFSVSSNIATQKTRSHVPCYGTTA